MSNIVELRVPDIGDFEDIPIIELPISVGDQIDIDETLLVLESDKSTMDVPALAGGRITEVMVSEGDLVSKGMLVARLDVSGKAVSDTVPAERIKTEITEESPEAEKQPTNETLPGFASSYLVYATPSIRRFARELGVDISKVKGSGVKGRITREDVSQYVKHALQESSSSTATPDKGIGLELPPWPEIDYAKYGSISRQKLSRIARISGPSLARNSIVIPHVTNFESADITELEDFRKDVNAQAEDGSKMTILAFVVKAVVAALTAYPKFNSSIDGGELILKEYYHIGVAADTPDGLVVPVIKNANRKGLMEIASEMTSLAALARHGKLRPTDMQGGTFTISSLGGIGGDNFTPIINAPEVAILGMVRSSIKPVWDGSTFQPRLIQPMSLSWDHRVVDGVAAAHFLKTIQSILQDFRRINL